MSYYRIYQKVHLSGLLFFKALIFTSDQAQQTSWELIFITQAKIIYCTRWLTVPVGHTNYWLSFAGLLKPQIEEYFQVGSSNQFYWKTAQMICHLDNDRAVNKLYDPINLLRKIEILDVGSFKPAVHSQNCSGFQFQPFLSQNKI